MAVRIPRRGPQGRSLGEAVKTLVLALLLSLGFRTVVAEPFTVPSGSMIPTLLVGDTLLASKFAYGFGKFSSPIGLMPDFDGRLFGHAPERGDVIVFRLPRDPGTSYVKRLIGLPGDHVQIRHGQLVLNGQAVPRRQDRRLEVDLDGQRISFIRYVETLPNGREHPILKLSDDQPLDDTPEFVVPARHYFMMGDNRDDSLDSRVAIQDGGVGFVPEENLVGRVDRILFSKDPAVAWWEVWKLPSALRASRVFDAIG
jgi:signal peptidase I